MADDRVAIVQRFMNAISASDLEALLAESHPDGELIPLVSAWPQPYHGHDGVREWWADLNGTWDEFTVQYEDSRELDDGALLVNIHWRARGRGGHPVVEGPSVVVFRFRDGKVLSAHVFVDERRALSSLG